MAKELEFGLRGFDIIDGTTTTTDFGAYVAVEGINGGGTFSATTAIGDAQPSQTLADGQVTYGPFLVCTRTAGTLKCYRNVEPRFDQID